jgi:hypothetical protein
MEVEVNGCVGKRRECHRARQIYGIVMNVYPKRGLKSGFAAKKF